MKNQVTETMDANLTNERKDVTMNEETRRILARLEELCEGVPENEFDSWLRKRIYPVLAAMPHTVDGERYGHRLAELCSGESENDLDNWLRERFYPVVALYTALGGGGK